MPKVTVLLTSYNHADFIARSIQSILDQTFKDFELVILDDCSTDNSWEVIKTFKDKRIKAIRREKNLASAINEEVISKFKGEYFAIAHCDDMWEKTKLEKQVKILDKKKDVAACFTHVKLIDEEDNEITNKNQYTDFNVKNKNRYAWLRYFFDNGNCLCHPSVLMRTKIQKEEKLYARGLGSLPDLYRWIKLCLNHEIYVVQEELTMFRVRKNGINTSGKNKQNLIRVIYDSEKVLDLYKTIDNKGDFIKIFPEAKEYEIKGKLNLNYALAQLCIADNTIKSKAYKKFGVDLLYRLLQDDKTRKEIEEIYNFTGKNFIQLTGTIDFYNSFNEENFIETKLFYNKENSFNENNKIEKKIEICSNNKVEITYDKIKKGIKFFRFDPEENRFIKIKNLIVEVNNKKVNYRTNSSFKLKGITYFITPDPQVFFSINEDAKNIKISFEINLIDNMELEQIIKKNYKKRIIKR